MNPGDTAWVLASAALVMLMTPGLAFFYGGMVSSKSVLNMLMMNFITLGVVGVLWLLYGYSMSFGSEGGNGFVAGLHNALLSNTVGTLAGPKGDAIPTLAFVMFQLMFAVITPALISGSIADRTKFWSWVLFVVVWVTVVYFPVAHWVFDFSGFTGPNSVGGWIANNLKAFDFAGGTAVHINAGSAGLALALVLGKRKAFPRNIPRPHNVPHVLLGAALLWFGWYGFNAGSALAAGDLASVAFTTTTVATAAALLGWIVVEQFRDGKPTTLGAASGAIAGLVAITPACGYVDPMGALVIGIAAGVICALCTGIKFRLGFDDSLDVVAVHLIGGIVGTLLIGFFATGSVNSAGGDGLFHGGGWSQLGKQAVAAGSVLAYSFVLAFVIGWIIHKTIGFRVSPEAELTGIDEAEHAETAYEFGGPTGGRSVLDTATQTAVKPAPTPTTTATAVKESRP